MTQNPNPTRRRVLQALGVVAIGGWVWGAPRLARLGRDPLTYRDIPGAAPFRTLEREGAVSAAAAIFAGLDTPPPPFTGSLCDALFGPDAPLSIAYFSDVNCPNCPRMEDATRRAIDGLSIPLIRHELPLLGPQSTLAAQAILAAQLQNGSGMAERLTALPGPITPPRLTHIAADIGIDAQQLLTDMSGTAVADHLARNHGIARRLGIYGTPGTVIGRTVILGALPANQIAQIIAQEQQVGTTCS